MKCPECGYEFNPNLNHWEYNSENYYEITSPVHHELIFEQIIEHYLNYAEKDPDWDKPYIWIIIDENTPPFNTCDTCCIHSHRIKRKLKAAYYQKNVHLSFMF